MILAISLWIYYNY